MTSVPVVPASGVIEPSDPNAPPLSGLGKLLLKEKRIMRGSNASSSQAAADSATAQAQAARGDDDDDDDGAAAGNPSASSSSPTFPAASASSPSGSDNAADDQAMVKDVDDGDENRSDGEQTQGGKPALSRQLSGLGKLVEQRKASYMAKQAPVREFGEGADDGEGGGDGGGVVVVEDDAEFIEGLETRRRSTAFSSKDHLPIQEELEVEASEDSVIATNEDTQTDEELTMLTGDEPTEASDAESENAEEREAREALLRKYERRLMIAREIVTTEESYVGALAILVELYVFPLSGRTKVKKLPKVTPEQVKRLFSNVSTLHQLHSNFLSDLHERSNDWTRDNDQQVVGDLFVQIAPFLKMSKEYINNFDKATRLLNRLLRDRKFEAFAKTQMKNPRSQNLGLTDYLITPVQRIPRYKLLLTDLIKHTDEDHPDFANLQKALTMVSEVATDINEAVRASENSHALLELQSQFGDQVVIFTPMRHFVHRGTLTKVCRGGDKAREFILFNDCLMYATKSNLGGLNFKRQLNIDVSFKIQELPRTVMKNALQISCTQKEFVVFSSDSKAIATWKEKLGECIRIAAECRAALEAEEEEMAAAGIEGRRGSLHHHTTNAHRRGSMPNAVRGKRFSVMGPLWKVGAEHNTIRNVNLPSLAAFMSGPGGVEIKDRRHFFKRHEKCFIGSEAVKWLVEDGLEGLVNMEEDAVAVLTYMQEEGMITHVSNDPSRPFTNNKQLFRFAVKSTMSSLHAVHRGSGPLAYVHSAESGRKSGGTTWAKSSRSHHRLGSFDTAAEEDNDDEATIAEKLAAKRQAHIQNSFLKRDGVHEEDEEVVEEDDEVVQEDEEEEEIVSVYMDEEEEAAAERMFQSAARADETDARRTDLHEFNGEGEEDEDAKPAAPAWAKQNRNTGMKQFLAMVDEDEAKKKKSTKKKKQKKLVRSKSVRAKPKKSLSPPKKVPKKQKIKKKQAVDDSVVPAKRVKRTRSKAKKKKKKVAQVARAQTLDSAALRAELHDVADEDEDEEDNTASTKSVEKKTKKKKKRRKKRVKLPAVALGKRATGDWKLRNAKPALVPRGTASGANSASSSPRRKSVVNGTTKTKKKKAKVKKTKVVKADKSEENGGASTSAVPKWASTRSLSAGKKKKKKSKSPAKKKKEKMEEEESLPKDLTEAEERRERLRRVKLRDQARKHSRSRSRSAGKVKKKKKSKTKAKKAKTTTKKKKKKSLPKSKTAEDIEGGPRRRGRHSRTKSITASRTSRRSSALRRSSTMHNVRSLPTVDSDEDGEVRVSELERNVPDDEDPHEWRRLVREESWRKFW